MPQKDVEKVVLDLNGYHILQPIYFHAITDYFSVLPGKNYEDIKKKCLEQGALWEDDEFPAVDKSIFYSRRPNKKFEWKRPGVSSTQARS